MTCVQYSKSYDILKPYYSYCMCEEQTETEESHDPRRVAIQCMHHFYGAFFVTFGKKIFFLETLVCLHPVKIPNPKRHMSDNIRFPQMLNRIQQRAFHSGCHMTHKKINAYVNQAFRTINKLT